MSSKVIGRTDDIKPGPGARHWKRTLKRNGTGHGWRIKTTMEILCLNIFARLINLVLLCVFGATNNLSMPQSAKSVFVFMPRKKYIRRAAQAGEEQYATAPVSQCFKPWLPSPQSQGRTDVSYLEKHSLMTLKQTISAAFTVDLIVSFFSSNCYFIACCLI